MSLSQTLRLSLSLSPFNAWPPNTHQTLFISNNSHSHSHSLLRSNNTPTTRDSSVSALNLSSFSAPKPILRRAVTDGNSDHLSLPGEVEEAGAEEKGWEKTVSFLASLYPLYVAVGGVVACVKPSAFAWLVRSAPTSYSLSLGLIMLAMGITLELSDLLALFWQRPLSILFGCVAQYTIMPAFGAIISRGLGLSPSLSVGLILLGCCPGGTASNVVTLIAGGDVPLSIVMTVCTTLGAVVLTPLLTKILAGTYVPVDALKLSLSTLQVVVAPILLGSYIQSAFPGAVKVVVPFAPLFAVLASSLLACSVFSENVIRLKSSVTTASLASDASLLNRVQALLTGEIGVVILSVLLLHFFGFFVGYISAALGGFKERQRRAISIEVGMQNSSLGVVLATAHFTSSMVALPAAMSAVIMNMMGSSLGVFWKYVHPSDSNDSPTKAD